MTNLLKYKKAQRVNNIFIGLVFLFAFGILTIIGYLINSAFITEFQATSQWDASTMTIIVNGVTLAYTTIDKAMALILVAFVIGIAVTSFRLASAPIFFFITFFMAAFYGFGAYIMSYTFQEIIGNTAFNTVRSIFPITILIGTNLHWVALANIVIGSLALFAKKPKGQFLDQ